MTSLAEHLGKAALRGEPRHGVMLDATVKAYRAAPLAAAVIDLSTGGAMLAADTSELRKGDEIVLDAAGREFVATVAWSNESFFGLAFHRRLDDREMSWLKRVGRA